MIKIFNKILWGIKPPENKSDIWFDGDVFKIYRKGDWEAITIEIDAASKLADVIKNINDVYQAKLTEGDGILLEDSKISVRRMFQVVSELPKTGEYNTIYLLTKNNQEIDSYTYINNKWVNLSSSITVDKYLSTTSTNPVENKVITKEIGTINNTIHNLDVVRIVDGDIISLETGGYKNGSVGSALAYSDEYKEVTLTGDHIGYSIQGVKWIHGIDEVIIPSFRANTSCTIILEDKNGNSGSIVMEVKSGLKVFLYIKTLSNTIHLIQNNTIILPSNINNNLTNLLSNYKIIALNSNGFGVDAFSHYFTFDLAKDNRELYFKNGDWEKIITENNIKTINGNSITGSGDIEIDGYDDTELNNKLTELSEKVDKELYAYPVDTLGGKENTVVGLGGEKLYMYIGEISIPSDMEEVEGTLPGDIVPTEYFFQPIYEGALQLEFYSEQVDPNLNLYIGNDKYGYTSLKIEPSEDPNNLKWFWAIGLGMFQEGPGYICFAWSDWTLHYKASYIMPCNIKVYWLYKTQKLDVNLIPQEIARKEDIAPEINNHEYPVVTVDADNLTYSGTLGSKYINIDINIANIYFDNKVGGSDEKRLQLVDQSSDAYRYMNRYIAIIFNKRGNSIVDIDLKNPVFTLDNYDLEYFDYKNCTISSGCNCKVSYKSTYYPAAFDWNDFVTALIDGKYVKYKLNRETHLLELQSEIDLNSIEARLAALESNVNIEAILNTEV